MRPLGSPQELERRRRRAIALLAEGLSQAEVARLLGVSESSIHRWRKMEHRGPEGLTAKPNLGRPRRLTSTQLHRLKQLLRRGATAYGWPNALWTGPRVAALIQRTFGVRYHPDHARKLMKAVSTC
jgi:transposase